MACIAYFSALYGAFDGLSRKSAQSFDAILQKAEKWFTSSLKVEI